MKIQCAIYRGGISKPIFFLENDLPKDAKKEIKLCSKHLAHLTSAKWMAWVGPTH